MGHSTSRIISDPEQTNDYSHFEPLDVVKKEIRLLLLHSGPVDQPIVCDIFHRSLKEATPPIYDCLSYCWGEVKDTVKITLRHYLDGNPEKQICAEQRYAVTKGLAQALHRLRPRNGSATIWIDAICINQGSTQERSEQVSIMRDIYSIARNVVVWLGPGDHRTAAAMDHMERLAREVERIHRIARGSIRKMPNLLKDANVFQPGWYYDKTTRLSREMLDEMSHFGVFFSVPWFRRVWVLQEVHSNANVKVWCGNKCIDWELVIIASEWFEKRRTEFVNTFFLRNQKTYDQHLPRLWIDLSQTKPKTLHALQALVFEAREFYATDPRDKVFALLGLAEETSDMSELPVYMRADYKRSTVQVYANLVYYLIETTKTLAILSAVSDLYRNSQGKLVMRDQDDSFPSWVPNLGDRLVHTHCIGYQSNGYKASGNSVPILGSKIPSTQFLSLGGKRFDRVDIVLGPMCWAKGGLLMKIDNRRVEVITWIWRNIITRGMPKAGPKVLSGFIETLTCAFARSGFVPGKPLYSRERFLIYQSPEGLQPGLTSLHADLCAYWLTVDPKMRDLSTECRNYLLQFQGQGFASSLMNLMVRVCNQRCFFTTLEKCFGVGPSRIESNDLVVVLYGGTVPYVLRPRYQPQASEPTFKFIGECYVQSRMFGSVVDEQLVRREPNEMFELR